MQHFWPSDQEAPAVAPICVSCTQKCFSPADVSQVNMSNLSSYTYLSQPWKAVSGLQG